MEMFPGMIQDHPNFDPESFQGNTGNAPSANIGQALGAYGKLPGEARRRRLTRRRRSSRQRRASRRFSRRR